MLDEKTVTIKVRTLSLKKSVLAQLPTSTDKYVFVSKGEAITICWFSPSVIGMKNTYRGGAAILCQWASTGNLFIWFPLGYNVRDGELVVGDLPPIPFAIVM